MHKNVRFIAVVILALLLHLTAQAGNDCDFTGNGIVNLEDYAELAVTWECCLPWGPDGPPPELIAHWRLDKNALDSQSGYNGEVYGDPVWLSGNNSAVGNGAIRMDGQDYIEIPDTFPALNYSLAIDAWVRTNGTGQDMVIISRGDSSWQLGVSGQSGCVFFSCSGLSGTDFLVGQSDITDNQWYHIAGVYDQQQQKITIYIDGEIDAEETATGSVNHRDDELWIGGNPEMPGARKWWMGDLDNIRIYNYAPSSNYLFQRKIYHVDQATGSNNNSGQGRLNAFKTIQQAIDAAGDGDMILVWPGIYEETVEFWEYKTLNVKSAADAAIIKAPGDYAVSFYAATADTVFENFVICDSNIGIFVQSNSPVLRFLTTVNNNSGLEAYWGSDPQINHCIFWNNAGSDIFNDSYTPDVAYSCIERFVTGEGNFSADPLFADPNNRDYHLQSEYGRYVTTDPNIPGPMPENWVIDSQTSPCIDAGNEFLNPMRESMPNGGRLNIGAYANTKYAAKSAWPYPADLNFDGQVEWEDFYNFIDNWLFYEPVEGSNVVECK